MPTRRALFTGLAGSALALGLVPGTAFAADAPAAAPAAPKIDPEIPTAKTIAGKPPYMDFGDGVKVPLSKGAFLTLWEGPTYWLTFGFGIASITERAQGLAVHHAIGAMKYLLLTLAFAPDRLLKVDGNGWRQKVEDPLNYVLGELELPGKPARAVTDSFMGVGNADANLFLGAGANLMSTGPSGGPNMATANTGANAAGMNRSAMLAKINAFCSYVVKKKDLSLEDVRDRAKEVHL